jgi:hypothetical protein
MLELKLISASLIALALMVALSGNGVVSSGAGSGAFTFTVYGYTVTGDLTGASVTHGGIVQMLMTIDQMIPIANGTVHITGNGVWSGMTNLQNLNGEINNVQGSVQACVLQTCQNAAFTGSGTWAGTIAWSQTTGSQASGTFQGALNFSGPQVNQTGPVPVSGNWTASFAI